MKIRFKTDLVDLFRRGINGNNSIASLEVDPATLRMDQRELIYKHLLPDEAGDALYVVHDPVRAEQPNEVVPIGGRPGADLVEARSPTLDSLLTALEELQSQASLSAETTEFVGTDEKQFSRNHAGSPSAASAHLTWR